MDITSPFLSVAQLGLVPLVLALVQIYKMVTGDTRFAPVIALAVGLGASFLVHSATWQLTVLAGLTIGCISAGVYSGIRATTGK